MKKEKYQFIGKGSDIVIETIDGRNTCFWCGHPVSPDKELNNVKSFLAQKIAEAENGQKING